MSAPILHAYRPDTGEYVGQILADPDPERAGEWLHPAFAVEAAPPEGQAGKAIVIRDGAWALLPDHRGETWFAADGGKVVVDRLGDPGAFKPPLLPTAPELPPPVPEVISDRQFAQALAMAGTITEAEALAWAARGELPKAMEDALDRIPDADGQRFGARMMLAAATTYERRHPLSEQLGTLLTNPATGGPYDAAELDALWTRAAAL